MSHLRRQLFSMLLLLLAAMPAVGQEVVDADVNARIREEGFERAQVMRTMHYLTDVFGPRLTGSPNVDRAGRWALEQLTGWGLTGARADDWDWGHVGWLNERLTAHVVAPVRDALVVEVLAWTPGTDGALTAEAVHLVAPERPTQADLDAYLASMRGRLDGRIVLVGAAEGPSFAFEMPKRYTDEEMSARYDPRSDAESPFSRFRRDGDDDRPAELTGQEVARQLDAFIDEHDVLLRVNPAGMDDGLIRAFANRSYDPSTALPTVVMRNEDYGRLTRLMADGMPVTLEFDIVNRIYPEGRTQYNYVAELRGAERPDEVVMIGGHLDSWHAATGATDNAAGVTVMMEAMRILKALDLRPKRTIRIALWTGEEQGLLGSQAYVAAHYGTYEDPKPAFHTFGGYLNVDSGTGRIRGASVFGPVEAAEVLEAVLAPFDDLGVHGARPTASRRVGGSDHTSFNAAGLPGIGLGQDPIQYFTHTWHTNIDTYERILEEDLQQAAVVVAATAYHLANRDTLLPRFPEEDMPIPPPGR